MEGLNIYMADGTVDGPIVMSSSFSGIKAVRVRRERASEFAPDLDGAGVYFLLVGNDSVYVGQSGLDSIKKRIMNTHSGQIDSTWHTVLAFICSSPSISSNELLYLENAMCEFVHNTYSKCLTTSPSKNNCNEKHRISHYKLMASQIMTCNKYLDDMKFYVSCFPNSIFGSRKKEIDTSGKTALFYFENLNRDCQGTAEIQIHCGNTKARRTILKEGSKISLEVSPNFTSSQSVINRRMEFQKLGIIVDRVLQADIPFNSQSGAGEFLNGTAFSGNEHWRTKDEKKIKLKELL